MLSTVWSVLYAKKANGLQTSMCIYKWNIVVSAFTYMYIYRKIRMVIAEELLNGNL